MKTFLTQAARAALALSLVLLAACDRQQEAAPDLADLRGQWVLINYWAIWCKPCIKEIPELNRVHAQQDGVTVLGVNFDGVTGAELEQQLARLDVAFPSLAEDPSAALGVPRPQVLPTTLVLAPDGRLATTLVGPQTLASLVSATVERNEPVPP